MFILKLVLVTSFVFGFKAEAKKYQWENITQEQYIDNLIDCQMDLKQYQWSKTIWPKSNSEPKPSFDEIIDMEDLRNEINNSIFKQAVLEQYFNIKITTELLQYDLNRMAKHTKDAQSLKEIYTLYDNDPVTMAHCVSRSYLVEAKLQNSYYWSSGIHQETKQLVNGELDYIQTNGQKNLNEQIFSGKKTTITYKVYEKNNLYQEKEKSYIALTPDEYHLKINQLQGNSIKENKMFFSYSKVVSEETDQITFNVFSWKKQSLKTWLTTINLNEEWSLPIATEFYITEITQDKSVNDAVILADTWEVKYKSPGERSGHSAVWTGTEMIIWGGGIGGIELKTGGRYNPSTDTWQEMSIANAPIARVNHTAVWTGSEMIVWGGRYLFNGYHYIRSGGSYNPITDTWSATSLSNAPNSRGFHTTVWSGNKMIVWGGYNGAGYFNTGGRYDPNTDSWQNITTTNAPSEREEHTAIWTGSEMIVWGGNNIGWLQTGGRYNPTLDQWQSINFDNPPSRRANHTAIWTGDKMIIWGGSVQSSYYNTGAVYDPSSDSWEATSLTNAPLGRNRHSAIWTGNEMIIWGGRYNESFGNGGRFNPNTNSWSEITMNNVPAARSSHSAIWTGTEMVVWGGIVNGSSNTGARYNPNNNTWQAVFTTDAPIGRSYHSTVWTGSEMIIWGGQNTPYLDDGSRYRPYSDSWQPITFSNAPSARTDHSVLWTGSEMIVWGGRIYENSGYTYLNTGARYNPLNDSWQTITNNQAPEGRYNHTGVWTGNEMVIWGGKGSDYFNSGGRYNPNNNSWSPTNSIGAPSARRSHTAIWSGSEMMVWGGYVYDGSSTYFNDGSRYDPINDDWQVINSENSPSARDDHSVIWTGDEMIIWGGGPGGAGNMLMTGGKYNPINDNWNATSTSNAPSARLNHSAIWTDSDMIVWGGYYSDGYQDYYKTGGVYNPVSNQWQATSLENSPRERQGHSAVWTGKQMIIWGGIPGSSGSSSTNTMGTYYPYDIDDLIFQNGFE